MPALSTQRKMLSGNESVSGSCKWVKGPLAGVVLAEVSAC